MDMMDGWTKGWMDGCIQIYIDGQMDRFIDGWIYAQRYTDERCIDRRYMDKTHRLIDRQNYGCIDRWIDICIDRYDGWMQRNIDEECIVIYI